jgi:DNA-binding MarR family transcriptional regulator
LAETKFAGEEAMARTAQDQTLLLLARAVMGISTRAADRLGQLSVVQLRALTVLRELGTANLGRLAEGLDVTVSTTSRLVDRLVAAELVERRPSPRTRREIELRVSAAGTQMLDRYDELRLEGLRTSLERLPSDRRDDVLAALLDFGAAASAHGPTAVAAR